MFVPGLMATVRPIKCLKVGFSICLRLIANAALISRHAKQRSGVEYARFNGSFSSSTFSLANACSTHHRIGQRRHCVDFDIIGARPVDDPPGLGIILRRPCPSPQRVVCLHALLCDYGGNFAHLGGLWLYISLW